MHVKYSFSFVMSVSVFPLIKSHLEFIALSATIVAYLFISLTDHDVNDLVETWNKGISEKTMTL